MIELGFQAILCLLLVTQNVQRPAVVYSGQYNKQSIRNSALNLIKDDKNIINYEDDVFIQELSAWASSPLPSDATRLFHGRGGFYKDSHSFVHKITLDWFPPVFLLTYFGDADELDYKTITDKYLSRWVHAISQLPHSTKHDNDQAVNLVFQYRSRSHMRNATSVTFVAQGMVPEPHLVTENGAMYEIHLLKGQNHGLFLDMANGRSWLKNQCLTRSLASTPVRVLNLFAYTCSFSVAALLGGATEVINMDMSRGALAIGRRNHEWNSLLSNSKDVEEDCGKHPHSHEPKRANRVKFLCHDIFKSWGKITRYGPYDIIVIDPPSFQKGSFIAKNDYGKVIRRIPSLLAPPSNEDMHSLESACSYALLCLNAPELSCQFLKDLVSQEAPDLEFVERLSNPTTFPALDEERALKILVYRLRSKIKL